MRRSACTRRSCLTKTIEPVRYQVFRIDSATKKITIKLGSYDRGSAHAHFLDCVLKGVNPPLSHARAARHVTEILLAGLKSAKSGRPVAILSKAEALD